MPPMKKRVKIHAKHDAALKREIARPRILGGGTADSKPMTPGLPVPYLCTSGMFPALR